MNMGTKLYPGNRHACSNKESPFLGSPREDIKDQEALLAGQNETRDPGKSLQLGGVALSTALYIVHCTLYIVHVYFNRENA